MDEFALPYRRVAYLHEKIYYATDVTFEGIEDADNVGFDLVNSIPQDEDDFKGWLRMKRAHYTRESERLRMVDKHEVLDYVCRPSSNPPIKIFYLVDLDSLTFNPGDKHKFRLENIPRGDDGMKWREYVYDFRIWTLGIHPSTPREYVAVPCPDIPLSKEHFLMYQTLNADLISESEWTRGLSTSETGEHAITTLFMRNIIQNTYGDYIERCQRPPTDVDFLYSSIFLLQSAAPGNLYLRSVLEEDPGNVGPTCHPPHTGEFFRFRGCLILLGCQLHTDSHVKANVARVVEHVRKRKAESCTALIWSMLHVVVVIVSGDKVSHSAAVPVLWAFECEEAAFNSGLQLLFFYLRPVHAENGKIDSFGKMDFGKAGTPHEVSCSPTLDMNRKSLPFDIVLSIMRFADGATYNASCSHLNKATRSYWVRHPRIGRFTASRAIAAGGLESRTKPARNALSMIGRCEYDLKLRAYDEDGSDTQIRLRFRQMWQIVEAHLAESPEDVTACWGYGDHLRMMVPGWGPIEEGYDIHYDDSAGWGHLPGIFRISKL